MIKLPIGSLGFIRQSKRAKRLLLATACLLMAYFLTPVALNKSAYRLIREDRLAKADAIVALGGDNRCHREKKAAELYRAGWGGKVVVSGLQYTWGIHTGEVARRYLIELGVPEADILMIRDTLNTRAEARVLEGLMRQHGWSSAIIVTSAFHSRRATYTVEQAARDFTFHSVPVAPVSPEWRPDRWWSRRDDVFITAREFVSWANTLANGWQ